MQGTVNMFWLSNTLYLDSSKVWGETDNSTLSNLYYTYLVEEINASEPQEFSTKQTQQNFNEKENETQSNDKNDKFLSGKAYDDNVDYVVEESIRGRYFSKGKANHALRYRNSVPTKII